MSERRIAASGSSVEAQSEARSRQSRPRGQSTRAASLGHSTCGMSEGEGAVLAREAPHAPPALPTRRLARIESPSPREQGERGGGGDEEDWCSGRGSTRLASAEPTGFDCGGPIEGSRPSRKQSSARSGCRAADMLPRSSSRLPLPQRWR